MLHKLKWRYATKKFDSEKIVPEDTVTELLQAMNLSASSYGLQPYKFIVIHDKEVQQSLLEHSWNQPQVVDASHLIVLAAQKNIDANFIQSYVQRIADVREQEVSELDGYRDMMLGSIGQQPEDAQLAWAQKQCYIALGTLLLAAADQKIDACPMEGFDPDAYDRILGLSDQGLRATVICPIGYRSVEDSYQHLAKVRHELSTMVKLYYPKGEE